MDNFEKKAKNYFILGKIAEKLKMYAESVSNYFKSLSAINDYLLEKLGLKAKDHSDRFKLLKENLPEFYEIADRLFTIYRRTYVEELTEEEINLLRKNLEEVFRNAKLNIPTDEEIEKYAKKFFER